MASLVRVERPVAAAAPAGLLVLHHGRGTDERTCSASPTASTPSAGCGHLGSRPTPTARLAGLPLVPGAAGRPSRPRDFRGRACRAGGAPRRALGGDRGRARAHRARRLLDGDGDELRDGLGRRPAGGRRHPRLQRLRAERRRLAAVARRPHRDPGLHRPRQRRPGDRHRVRARSAGPARGCRVAVDYREADFGHWIEPAHVAEAAAWLTTTLPG